MPATWTAYEDRLNRVSAYIYEHLDDELDLAALSDVAALSPWHWHRVYQAMRGESVVATTRRLRLQRAAVDLAQTGRPIEAIAARAGYGSVQAFTRAFAGAFGQPPAAYRKSGSHADFRPGELGAPNANFSIEIRSLPTQRLVVVEHIGPYMEIGRAFERLFGLAGVQGLLAPPLRMLAIFGDDPTLVPEDRLRSHAGLFLAGEAPVAAPLACIETRPGPYAVLRHRGPYADMRAAYRWMFGTWLPQSGREAEDAPVLEEYLNDPKDTQPADLLTDLCLPLR